MATAKLRSFIILALTTTIASCGGSDLQTGVFSDSPVGGLSYTTATTEGVTNSNGQFKYREGETVVFGIGNLVLPVVVGSDLVTPLDMAGSDDVTDPEVVNIARLLQSLDDDDDPDNGISIPPNAAHSFIETTIFDPTDDAAVDAVVSQLYGDEKQAVSADQAVAHFVDSLSAEASSSGTLDQLHYIVPEGSEFAGESLYVDDQVFTLTVDGDVRTGMTTVRHGVYQLAGPTDNWFVSVNAGRLSQFACIARAPQAVENCTGDLYHVFKDEQSAMDFDATSGLAIGAGTDENSSPDAPEESEIDLQLGAAQPGSEEVTLESLFPNCAPGTIDSDGDGFGWQNNQSCLIVVDGVPVAEESSSNQPGTEGITLESLFPNCAPGTVDNGDGFGWQNGQSCLIVVDGVLVAEESNSNSAPDSNNETAPAPTVINEPVQTTPEPAPVITPDPVPVVTPDPVPVVTPDPVPVVTPDPVPVVTPDPVPVVTPDPVAAVTPDPVPVVASVQPEDITDIIVLTGQANAAAVDTDYDPALDAGNENLFAYNEDGQWRVADLNQFWHENLPSNFASAAEGREPFNNLAFQTGKSLTAQSDRVVGIIMITAPGEGISHWDFNSDFYQQMRNKVNAALAQLPQKATVDAMIWMQGETDWLFEGSADSGATGFASIDSDFYRNYYPNKLNQLVSNLRGEAWFGFDAQFICGETKKAALNPHLLSLNSDGDDLTSCAVASDLPVRTNDPFGNHFSAEGLRVLGGRIADLYINADQ